MGDNSDPDQVVLYDESGNERGTQSFPLFVQSDDAQPVTIQDAQATSATTARFAITTTATTVLVANPDRRGVIIFNEGGKEAIVKYGADATPTDYTFQVPTFTGYWEMPSPIYTGVMSIVVSSSTTTVQVTETET